MLQDLDACEKEREGKACGAKEGWSSLVDWEKVHIEHRSGVTLQVLWEEYKESKALTVN
jgi:hypothetical protein